MGESKKIILANDQQMVIQECSNIVYLESLGKKSKVYCCSGEELIVGDCLSSIEEKLPDENFFKIHKSFIVNIDYLKSINKSPEKTILLKNGIVLKIASRKFKSLIDFVKGKYGILQ